MMGRTFTKQRTCTHHCRSCGSCFTSLEAFDCHGPGRPGECEWPDDVPLVEVAGVCRISDADEKRVTVHEHSAAQRLREHRRAGESAQTERI